MGDLEADKLAALPPGHHARFWHASMQEFERQLAVSAPPFKHGQPYKYPADPRRHSLRVQVARLRWIIRTATDPRAGGAYEAARKNAEAGLQTLRDQAKVFGEPDPTVEVMP